MKYAYVNVQAVAAASAEGKAAAEKIKVLQEQKSRELQEKNKTLQSAQQKLEQGGSVLSDQARAQLQAEIERQQRDLQRFTEDAQQDVQQLAEQVEGEFNRKLTPIIDRVAKQKGVHFVFNAAQSGLIWAEPGMDLTAEVIQAFDSQPPRRRLRPAPPAEVTRRPAPGRGMWRAPRPSGAPRARLLPIPVVSHRRGHRARVGQPARGSEERDRR